MMTTNECDQVVRRQQWLGPPSKLLRLLGILFFALPHVALADRPSSEELTSKIDQYMAARVDRDHFNGTVLLAKNGQALFCRGYGMANLEHDVPCAPNTKFRLGSITKQFTAMAILILQERGKLAVTDKVKKYISSAPKAWDDITIHHLLTHTSGIPNYTGFPDFLKTLRNPVTLDELIAKFKDKPLDFKPGEKFKYSNSGYIVLGKITETASGRPYDAFLKEAIFDPLGMRDTGYDNAATILKNRASGYSRLLGLAPANSAFIDMSIPHAAGALYSTVLDLLKWDRALDSEKLLPRKSIEAMFTPFKDRYGYGWTIDNKFDQPRQSHAGGIPGFVTYIQRFPAEKLLVVVLSNFEASKVGTIGSDLAAIALGGPYVIPREPKPVQVDVALLATYAGQYAGDSAEANEKLLITVTVDGNTLKVEPKGQARLLATPESEARFYLKATDATLEFAKDSRGIVDHLTLLQNNRNIKATRVEPAANAGKAEKSTPKPDSQSAKPPGPLPAKVPGATP
jgi:CubicO group peptidase (beta-lactamase class C family)